TNNSLGAAGPHGLRAPSLIYGSRTQNLWTARLRRLSTVGRCGSARVCDPVSRLRCARHGSRAAGLRPGRSPRPTARPGAARLPGRATVARRDRTVRWTSLVADQHAGAAGLLRAWRFRSAPRASTAGARRRARSLPRNARCCPGRNPIAAVAHRARRFLARRHAHDRYGASLARIASRALHTFGHSDLREPLALAGSTPPRAPCAAKPWTGGS